MPKKKGNGLILDERSSGLLRPVSCEIYPTTDQGYKATKEQWKAIHGLANKP